MFNHSNSSGVGVDASRRLQSEYAASSPVEWCSIHEAPPNVDAPKIVSTVADYLADVPGPARTTLISLRAAIRSALPPDVTETISYRMPAFKRDGVLVWYAAFADHCSLFPGGSVLQRFKSELAGYQTSKGTIQFALDKPLPLALIKRIVKARVAEHEARQGP